MASLRAWKKTKNTAKKAVQNVLNHGLINLDLIEAKHGENML